MKLPFCIQSPGGNSFHNVMAVYDHKDHHKLYTATFGVQTKKNPPKYLINIVF